MRAIIFLWALAAFAADPAADLLQAAKKGRTAQVETLLSKGASLEAKDKEGRTALMLAAQYGRAEAVRLLLSKGARPDARDNRGWNAFMLALLSPAGGVIHTTHDAVLKLLPPPAHLRVAVDVRWATGSAVFSSCFMRPEQLEQHIRGLKPDGLVLEAFRRFAAISGRGLMEVVDAPADADATLSLLMEPGAACVQQSDHLSLLIHTRLLRAQGQAPILEKTFGSGVKTGMRGETAANPSQYSPLFEAWAKSQSGPIYWAVVAALMQSP